MCEYCMKTLFVPTTVLHTHHIGWTEFEEPQFLIYWIIKRISDFRIREYCMKNVICIYKMTHSVFFKDGMPIFQGFTEKHVTKTVIRFL